MTAQTWISVALAVIAGVALFFTGLSSISARQQTKIQDKLRKDAAQPYVWVDLRPDEAQGGLLLLLIGNSGVTVATDFRVRFEPSLMDQSTHRSGTPLTDRISSGIASLPPERVLTWSLGSAFAHIPQDDLALRHEVHIDATGPFGPLPTLRYMIDLEDLRYTKAPREGSMHLIAKAVEDVSKQIAEARERG